MTFKERFENNFTLGILAIVVSAFSAGYLVNEKLLQKKEEVPTESTRYETLREELTRMRTELSTITSRLHDATDRANATSKALEEAREAQFQLTQSLTAERQASEHRSDLMKESADAIGALVDMTSDPKLRLELKNIQADLAVGAIRKP